jgi:hypothetical protein
MWRVHIGARLIAALLGTLRILPLHWLGSRFDPLHNQAFPLMIGLRVPGNRFWC